MARIGSTWAMVLRCPDCKEPFTVTGVPEAEVAQTADLTTCPRCGYRPRPETFLRVPHLITSLKREVKEPR